MDVHVVSTYIVSCFQHYFHNARVPMNHSQLRLGERNCVIGLPVIIFHILQHKRGSIGNETCVATMLCGRTALCHSPDILTQNTTHWEM